MFFPKISQIKPAVLLFTTLLWVWPSVSYAEDWFEVFKKTASDQELYQFLYSMPKGGDLHHHMSGSALSDWWYTLALEQKKNGYEYFTKTKINNCKAYGTNQFGYRPYLLMFHNLQKSSYQKLSECERSEYKKLGDLNSIEKEAWMNSIRLNHQDEGRDEFFQTHWQRLDDLYANPFLMAEILVKNMQAFADEGLIYMESMMGASGFKQADGTMLSSDAVADLYRARLKQTDAEATGMTVRLQTSILRFADSAEQQLIQAYELVSRNNDLYLAVNMVGREDNDKGHPLRFKETLRTLRKKYHNVRLSIHAGEVDEPNHHIRDTLLIGADRIGHGVNLISDNELMRQMRYGPYLVEINLISNLLLEYVDDYSQHPFPEYLRLGIPVALSTDDRGMWDSNLTDEFFVAVKEFNLSWDELKTLSQNSLKYSFVDDSTKQQLVRKLSKNLAKFEQKVTSNANIKVSLQATKPVSYSFICRYYQLCAW
jgi:adenosine deaminase CECR1